MPQAPLPQLFTPMLATNADKPFDSERHLFELKWDGIRVLAFCDRSSTRLYTRNLNDVTATYPELADLHTRLRVDGAVLDGEIFAADFDGRPSFGLLQQRMGLSRPQDARKASTRVAIQLAVFDIPFARGEWLGDLPLHERLSTLERSLVFDERVVRSDPIERNGLALFEAVSARGLEGIVAKEAHSKYFPGRRTKSWLKIKVLRTIECVIGGWNPGQGDRAGLLGSLALGLYDRDSLEFIGSVGTGFDDKSLHEVMRALEQMERSDSPFNGPVPLRHARWVDPKLVCRVEYREMTSAQRLRAPSFKGLLLESDPLLCRLAGRS